MDVFEVRARGNRGALPKHLVMGAVGAFGSIGGAIAIPLYAGIDAERPLYFATPAGGIVLLAAGIAFVAGAIGAAGVASGRIAAIVIESGPAHFRVRVRGWPTVLARTIDVSPRPIKLTAEPFPGRKKVFGRHVTYRWQLAVGERVLRFSVDARPSKAVVDDLLEWSTRRSGSSRP